MPKLLNAEALNVQKNFQQALKDHKLLLVEFFAPW